MSNRNLRKVSDNDYPEVIRADTHPLRFENNREVSQQQWEQIAHNLPVGESVSFTEATTRTVSRYYNTQPIQSGPHSAGDWVLVLAIMSAVVGIVVGGVILLVGGS